MKLSIGFSPCPNDTFIFDALVNGDIDTGGIEWDIVMEDVQTLNEWAIEGKLDISKISYATLPLVLPTYLVLHSGGALGKGVGPLLISRIAIPDAAIRQCTIAIPGKHTTANVLFSLAYPEAVNKVFLRYDEIEKFVHESAGTLEDIQGIRLGVIIHENRFTYAQRGFVKLADLGETWEQHTGFPIPLGGIVVKRSIPADTRLKIGRLIRDSIRKAWNKYPQLSPFIRENAKEMEEKVMREHINLYVNDYSDDLGEKGREAVLKFLQVHSSIHKIPIETDSIFIS